MGLLAYTFHGLEIKTMVFEMGDGLEEGKRTLAAGRELHVTPLHAVEGLALLALLAFGHHAVAVRQLPAQDVAEDLGVAVRVGGEALARGDAVFVQHAQRAEGREGRVVVAGEGEGVVAVQPAVVGVAAGGGAAGRDAGVGEGHGEGAGHGLWGGWRGVWGLRRRGGGLGVER